MFPREQRACDDEAFLPHDVAAIQSLAVHRPLLRLSTVLLAVMANIAAGCSGGGDAQSTATGSFTGAAVPPPTSSSGGKSPVTVAPTPADPNAAEGSPAQRISRGANGNPIVALSFKASFGMTGIWAEKNPDAFRRVVNEGHHLINHTYSHQSWTGLPSWRPSAPPVCSRAPWPT